MRVFRFCFITSKNSAYSIFFHLGNVVLEPLKSKQNAKSFFWSHEVCQDFLAPIKSKTCFFFDFSCKFLNFKSKASEMRVKLKTPNFYHVYLRSFRKFFPDDPPIFEKKKN